MSMFLDVVAALLALGTAAVWILTARGELPPDWDHLRTMSRGYRSLAMKTVRQGGTDAPRVWLPDDE